MSGATDQRLIRFEGSTNVGERNVESCQLIQNLHFARCAADLGQPADQLGSVLQSRDGLAMRITPPGRIRRQAQVLYGSGPIGCFLEMFREFSSYFVFMPSVKRLQPFSDS